MATATILAESLPYYTVRIEFGDQVFDQTLISIQTGNALERQFQGYADQYEIDWNLLQAPVEEPPTENTEPPL